MWSAKGPPHRVRTSWESSLTVAARRANRFEIRLWPVHAALGAISRVGDSLRSFSLSAALRQNSSGIARPPATLPCEHPEGGGVVTTQDSERATLPAMRPWIRSVVAKRVPAAEVEDIVQEVYVAALAASELPEEPPRLRAWLFQVATRRVADHFRRGPKTHAALEDTDVECPRPGSWQWLAAAEDRSRLKAAWRRLAEEARRLLDARYVRSLPYKQIAKETGLSERAVEYRLQTAREELRGLLGEDGP